MMSIRRSFAASSLWVVLGNGANNLVGFVIFAILARLLDPSSIGLIAFTLIFIDFGRIVVFGGLPEAVVQRSEWDDRVSSTCFTANLIASLVFFVLVAGVVSPLVSAYYMPGSGLILAILAAIYVIDGVRAVPEAKLRREFKFKPLAARGSIANALSGVVAIVMALTGFGVWALVVQRLISAVVQTVLTWRAARWTPSLTLSRSILRELSPFIYHLTPARLLTVVTAKTAEFTVGLVLGPTMIAYYRVGGRGLEAIAQFTVVPIQQAALSAFSRLGDARAIGDAYARVTRLSAFLACPVYLGAAAVAPDFVLLVFGPQWGQSGAVMTALALAVGSSALGYFIQPALTAAGRSDLVLISTVGSFVATVAMAGSTVWFGTTAVAIGISVLQYLSLPFRLLLVRKALVVTWQRIVGGLLPSLAAAAVMASAVMVVRLELLEAFSPLPRMLLSILVGVVVYPALLLIFARSHLRILRGEIEPLLPERIRRLLPGLSKTGGAA